MNTTEYTTFMVPNSDELQQLSELYKAMGDYTRMRILWYLMEKEYCVSIWQKKYRPLNLQFPINYVRYGSSGWSAPTKSVKM